MQHRKQDLVGKTVGHYILMQPMGPEGATGIVYSGKHLTMERPAAVKILIGSGHVDERKISRFSREAKMHATLEHPNIAPIYDHGFDAVHNVFYIAARLIEGVSLADVLGRRQDALSFEETLEIASQLASAPEAIKPFYTPASLTLEVVQ